MRCNIRPLLFIAACALTQPLTAWSATQSAQRCTVEVRDRLGAEGCPERTRSAYPLAHLFENPSESRTSLVFAALLLGAMASRSRAR